jgi:hypothetical protein
MATMTKKSTSRARMHVVVKNQISPEELSVIKLIGYKSPSSEERQALIKKKLSEALIQIKSSK